MLDFEVQRCTRRCCKTDRELQPGETFYSVLLAQGSQVVRQDYCAQAWSGTPSDALGSWKSQMPDASARKVHWAPTDVLLHYFEQLENQPGKEALRYVLALLLIRRRIVRAEEEEAAEGQPEQLVVFCPRNETEYRVQVAMPAADRMEAIQRELAELLFAKAG